MIVVLLAQAFYLPGIAGINEVFYFLAGGSGIAQSPVATVFAPQLDKDADGDGVPFSRDRCPDTPTGTTVTPDGCAESGVATNEMASKLSSTGPTDRVIDSINIHFDSGSSAIPQDALWKIAQLADGLKKHPNTSIFLDGHTDSAGARELNEKLSRARVETIRERLIFNHRIPPNRIYVTWFNADQPAADNVTAAGRSANRRVEVQIRLIQKEKLALSAP